MPTFRPLRWILTVLSFVAFLGVKDVGAVEVSPLDLVADTAAVCLEVPNLDASWQRIEQSRLAERVRAFAPFQRLLLGAGFQQWAAVENHVTQMTGLPLSEQLRGLCAESLVLAVYLPEGAKPQGVMIARARDAATLSRSVAALNKLEPQHVDQSKQHLGQTYIKRLKSPKSKEVLFYVLFDQTLVLSDHEPLVRQAIEMQQAAVAHAESQKAIDGTIRTLRESPAYRAARARLPENGVAFVHVNSRAWDKTLREGAKNDNEAAVVLGVWRCVSALAGSLRLEEGLALDVVAELDRTQLPSGWTEFVRSTEAPTKQASSDSRWSERIPAAALLAVSGGVDVRPLIRMWLAVDPGVKSNDFVRTRRVLRSVLGGRDLIEEVLPALLSDITVHASAPEQVADRAAPFEVLGQFSWMPKNFATASNDDEPQLAASLDNALSFGLNFLGAHLSGEHPESHIVVRSKGDGTTTRRWLEGLPLGEPGYGIVADRLFVSSSKAELLRVSSSSDPLSKQSGSTRLRDDARRFFGTATQLVWFDSIQTRAALTKHSDWIATTLAGRSEKSKPSIQTRLSRFSEVLQLFDAAFIAGSLHDDHLRVTLGVALD